MILSSRLGTFPFMFYSYFHIPHTSMKPFNEFSVWIEAFFPDRIFMCHVLTTGLFSNKRGWPPPQCQCHSYIHTQCTQYTLHKQCFDHHNGTFKQKHLYNYITNHFSRLPESFLVKICKNIQQFFSSHPQPFFELFPNPRSGKKNWIPFFSPTHFLYLFPNYFPIYLYFTIFRPQPSPPNEPFPKPRRSLQNRRLADMASFYRSDLVQLSQLREELLRERQQSTARLEDLEVGWSHMGKAMGKAMGEAMGNGWKKDG